MPVKKPTSGATPTWTEAYPKCKVLKRGKQVRRHPARPGSRHGIMQVRSLTLGIPRREESVAGITPKPSYTLTSKVALAKVLLAPLLSGTVERADAFEGIWRCATC